MKRVGLHQQVLLLVTISRELALAGWAAAYYPAKEEGDVSDQHTESVAQIHTAFPSPLCNSTPQEQTSTKVSLGEGKLHPSRPQCNPESMPGQLLAKGSNMPFLSVSSPSLQTSVLQPSELTHRHIPSSPQSRWSPTGRE